MAIRYLKIVLVVLVALEGLLYALQNIVNLDAAYQAVLYVVSMQDHSIYPASLGPSFENPVFVWIFLAVIVSGEILVGLIASKGAWNLWTARNATAVEFNTMKTYAILGCGLAMVVWFGLFNVVAGAYFQMWQTAAGALSLEGAFQYGGLSAMIMLFVNMADS